MGKFKVGEKEFSSAKLDAFSQMHIYRRLTPLLGGLARLAELDFSKMAIKKDADGLISGVDFGDDPALFIAPFTDALAGMKDADVEYICNKCLAVTEYKQKGNWAPLMRDDRLMFPELDMMEVLEIAAHVLGDNLQNFFKGRLSLSSLVEALGVRLPG